MCHPLPHRKLSPIRCWKLSRGKQLRAVVRSCAALLLTRSASCERGAPLPPRLRGFSGIIGLEGKSAKQSETPQGRSDGASFFVVVHGTCVVACARRQIRF